MDLGSRNFQSDGLVNFTQSASDKGGVCALVLVGGRPQTERFGEFPLALLDVLGRSVLMRTLDRIRGCGISEIVVLSDTEPLPPHPPSAMCKFSVANAECFWDEALRKFRKLGRKSEYVLVLRLGAWAEVDFAAMVREHHRSGSAMTRACSQRGEALDVFVISSSSSSEAAALLQGGLRDERLAAVEHKAYCYANLLTAPADLRTLILDAFAGESQIRPCGRELRPGVWVGRGARVHRNARVVAPAFIGDFCNVHRDAVVTRGSSLEHHSEVDCATVIDNSSVMPYTRVGAGLEMEHSVAGFRHVHSLQRKVTVEIEDSHLIGVTTRLFARMAKPVSWFIASLPNVLWRLLFGPRSEQVQGTTSDALGSPTPALGNAPFAGAESEAETYREMAVPRRYGNQ